MRSVRDLPVEIAWELAELERGNGADLRRANLRGADLRGADLRRADLRGADLRRADLRGADLRGATLWEANLWGADLRGANLGGANLWGANLGGANLTGTCLDPANVPNGKAEAFPKRGDGWVNAWRTESTSAAGKRLIVGRIYGCEVFSTADTECHPGWYLWPSPEAAKSFALGKPLVLVKARLCDIHQAGSKWRARTIWVLECV